MKELDNTPERESMLREALLLLRSMEWTETRMKRLIWDLEQAEKNFNEPLQIRLRTNVKTMLVRIKQEDINVERFLKKYKGMLNEKEKSLFNTREKK
jgi:hypothetical protein